MVTTQPKGQLCPATPTISLPARNRDQSWAAPVTRMGCSLLQPLTIQTARSTDCLALTLTLTSAHTRGLFKQPSNAATIRP